MNSLFHLLYSSTFCCLYLLLISSFLHVNSSFPFFMLRLSQRIWQFSSHTTTWYGTNHCFSRACFCHSLMHPVSFLNSSTLSWSIVFFVFSYKLSIFHFYYFLDWTSWWLVVLDVAIIVHFICFSILRLTHTERQLWSFDACKWGRGSINSSFHLFLNLKANPHRAAALKNFWRLQMGEGVNFQASQCIPMDPDAAAAARCGLALKNVYSFHWFLLSHLLSWSFLLLFRLTVCSPH